MSRRLLPGVEAPEQLTKQERQRRDQQVSEQQFHVVTVRPELGLFCP
jgi:hypothetical protein